MQYMQPVAGPNALAQLRRGVVEHCVLALLEKREWYGLELAEAMGDLVVAQGTIYPLLARLRREGLVNTTWTESREGPPRRYYQLTGTGRSTLEAFKASWHVFVTTVDAILNGEPHDSGPPCQPQDE
jgi:PadR family transcriptional regulator PadR